MGIGKRLKEAREKAGLTQEELGKRVGVTGSSITNYEKETSHPKEPVMYALMDVLQVEPNYLFQDCVNIRSNHSSPLSESELVHIQKYRNLDSYGQATVTAVLDCEYKRCTDKDKASSQKIVEIFPTRHYLQPASAGYGDFNDDESYEMIDLVKRPPNGTSFIITVHGDSMEPTYKEGDLLFVRSQNQLNIGDKGIVTIGALTFVKELGPDGLISHNPNYTPPEPFEDTPVIIQGKVLGICTEDYLS